MGLVQAIISIKKGAYLLKCQRSGKPKFCPFRLSAVGIYDNMTQFFDGFVENFKCKHVFV